MKIVLFFLLSLVVAFGSIKEIDTKIYKNKKQYNQVKQKKTDLHKTLSTLASQINKEEQSYKQIVNRLEKTSNQLLLNKLKLSNSENLLRKLKQKSSQLEKKKLQIEKQVLDFVVEKYAMSMGVAQANKGSKKDIINKEVYTLVFENTKDEIFDLNVEYFTVNNRIRENEKSIKKLQKYIKQQEKIKKRYKHLLVAQEKILQSLNKKHKQYQRNLQRLIDQQNSITDLLGSLNILKKKELKAEERRIKRAKALAKKRAYEKKRKELLAKKAKQQAKYKAKATKQIKFKRRKQLDDNINIEVKKIGSSAKGVKVSKYNGAKTIAPLKSYVVTKKFGKYYDKVYKMELFNESVSLKTKIPNAKVFSVFKGQVVYAKQNQGLLENVVIVKHKNNLHTIYSHLDRISPTLKVGKWIPKGYVVGRVSDTLLFQATKNSKYIDPLKLIK